MKTGALYNAMMQKASNRTGMEPFFLFLETVRYAFQQIRVEWRNVREYRRGI